MYVDFGQAGSSQAELSRVERHHDRYVYLRWCTQKNKNQHKLFLFFGWGALPPAPLVFGWGDKARPDPPPKRSSAAFDRGGQTGPPRSNAFFFGAADDTGAADDRPAGRPASRSAGRTSVRTPAVTLGRTSGRE